MTKTLSGEYDPHDILIETRIGNDMMELLRKSMEACEKTGRGATVSLKFSVRMDAETEVVSASAKVQSCYPVNSYKSDKIDLPAQKIIALDKDVPGQAKLFCDSESIKEAEKNETA